MRHLEPAYQLKDCSKSSALKPLLIFSLDHKAECRWEWVRTPVGKRNPSIGFTGQLTDLLASACMRLLPGYKEWAKGWYRWVAQDLLSMYEIEYPLPKRNNTARVAKITRPLPRVSCTTEKDTIRSNSHTDCGNHNRPAKEGHFQPQALTIKCLLYCVWVTF